AGLKAREEVSSQKRGITERTDMTEAVERLKTEARSLTSRERADLAHFLLQSLDQGEDADAEAAWDAELARRAAEIESGKVTGIPADQVFAEIRKKYQ